MENALFSNKFHDFHVPRLHHGEFWSGYSFFRRLWIELGFCMYQHMISVAAGKIRLAKTNWFFHLEIQLFD